MSNRQFRSIEKEITARGGADAGQSHARAKQIFTGLKNAKLDLGNHGPALKR